MSRAFAGPSSNDTITFSAGTAPPDQGPFTIAALVKANAGFGWFASGNNGSTPNWAAGLDTSAWFMWNDFTSGKSQTITTGHWAWVVVTKATGSQIPRWHLRDVTSAGSWTHTNTTGGTVADNTGTITNVLVGNFGGAGAANCWQGSIAAVAAWDTTFTDLQVEALATLSAADLLSGGGVAAAKWMVRLNQASTATSVPDDTGGGGNQSAISGTSVDVDEPPGWSYTLSSTVNGTSSATGAGVATASAIQRAGSSATGSGSASAVARMQAGSSAVGAGTATGSAGGTVTGTSSATGASVATATAVQSAGSTAAGAGTATAAATLRPTSTAAGVGTASALAVQVATATAIGAGVATGNAGGAVTGTSSATGAGVASATAAQLGSSSATGAGAATGAVRISATSAAAGAGVASGVSRLVIFGTSAAVGLGVATGTAGSRITPRPFTGVTARPSSGTTIRPFAGVTARP